jgi:hypothetical protein
MARHPGLWVADLSNLGVVLGIVWAMTQKSGTASSIAAVLGGYLVGAAVALPFTRLPAEELTPAAEPAS